MIVPLPFQFDDGGRTKSGFKGAHVGDCVARAIAIASGLPYLEIYDSLNRLAKAHERPRRGQTRSSARNGVYRKTYDRLLKRLGFTWVPTMGVGTGTTVHLRRGELPETGRLVVSVSKHLTAVVNGVIRNTEDPSRDGTRCVCGYYQPETK